MRANFDTGTPGLSTGQNAPFDQTSGAVTAHFSAPAGAGIYSIQTDASTGFTLADTLPMGTLSFSSLPGQSFNLVEIGIQPGGGTGFLPDNITVTLVPERSSLLMILSGLLAAAFRPPTPSSLRPYPSIPSRQPA
jgi:hypothetical protein